MELSKEEQEAIEFIERISKHVKKCTGCETPYLEGKIKRLELILIEKDWDIFKTVLNLIQKQSKVIDEMADKLSEYTCWNKDNLDMNKLASIEEIRQYFYRKAEEA